MLSTKDIESGEWFPGLRCQRDQWWNCLRYLRLSTEAQIGLWPLKRLRNPPTPDVPAPISENNRQGVIGAKVLLVAGKSLTEQSAH
jgi:hypothetical protein